MNDDTITPRWMKTELGSSQGGPSPAEIVVLEEVVRALRRVRHGTVQLSIQDGRVVQIDTTEKKRL